MSDAAVQASRAGSRSRDDAPPPATLAGLGFFVINKFGYAILSLIYLVVFALVGVFIYREIKPDWHEARAISDNIRAVAEAQLIISENMLASVQAASLEDADTKAAIASLRSSVESIRASLERKP